MLLTLDENGAVISMRHSGLNAGYRSLFEAHLQPEHIVVSLSNSPGGVALNDEIIGGSLLMMAADDNQFQAEQPEHKG